MIKLRSNESIIGNDLEQVFFFVFVHMWTIINELHT